MAEQKSERLLSLDILRGITIAGMILVNNPGTWGAIYPPLEHAKWNGCTPTDLIFPFFLFIVGVAVTFSLSKRKERGDNQTKLMAQIFRRSATLFLLGMILAIPFTLNFTHIRIPGVLQRIALVYLITSLIFLKTSWKTQAYIAGGLLLLYWGLMTLVPVPGVGYANLEPATNLGAWLDNLLLGGHLWGFSKVWDPEGLLSSMPAISTGLLGALTGHWLKSQNEPIVKTVWMFVFASFAMFLGYVWNGWFPINKSLWTSSYVLYTGGLALNMFALCYWLVDIKGYKWWTKPFVVYGTNAIAVFFLSGVVGRLMGYITVNTGEKSVSLQAYLFNSFFLSWLEPLNASLLWAITYVLIWLGLMWILYAKKIFIKV